MEGGKEGPASVALLCISSRFRYNINVVGSVCFIYKIPSKTFISRALSGEKVRFSLRFW